MKLKDLYNSTKVIKSSSLEDMAADVESESFIEQTSIDEERFYPNVDFSDPSQFAIYGSAEKYYTDAFARIRTLYPYDGSEAEKAQWLNESTFIDKYIFDHKYPRFNGHINLGYPTWGSLSGGIIDGYGKSTTNTFIKTFGGPNKSDLSGLENQFGDANKLDTVKSRESNLKFNLNEGVTVEMWVKKPAFDTSKTEKEVLFDLWNGQPSSSAQYGRFRLELTGAAAGSPFLFTALSGTNGIQNQSCGQNVTTSSITDWTHIALSLKNTGSNLSTNLYINGALNHQQTISSAALNNITGSIISFIGALQTAPSGSPTIQTGAGKFSGSLDEFRYWKTERTAKQIGRYYWNTIGGGTNTDEANTKLGVYYKFNEGITQTASFDSNVLDYSGRVSNGAWTGYVSGARSTDSAMVLAKVIDKEFKDPTIRSNHPDYISTLSELEASGSHYDMYNNSSIFHTMPQWILEDDDVKEGNLRNLTQIIASYFDNMHLHIREVNRLKDIYAHFQTKTGDEYGNTSTSGSVKPLPFADRLLTNASFVAPELFSDATVLEKLAKRSEDENYEMKLHDVKNQIYQNVYSGLINTYKEKGTNKGFRNILHAFGIDEEVVKINFYGNNVEFELKDRYSIRSVKEKFIDFNNPDRFNASIYQIPSGSNISFITGSTSNFEKFIPLTFETQIILPNKLPFDEPFGFATPFTKSVIAGMHQATSNTNYAIANPDKCDMQMYVERDETESKRVKFHLSSSALGVHLSSSLYDGMYDNNEWLLAFKIVNDKHPTANLVSSSDDGNYKLHFIGYNTVDSSELNSFVLTSSVASASAHSFLVNSKRIYAGAKRTNFTGSLVDRSDIKLGFTRLWYSELSNETLKRHSSDSRNYGANSPFRSAYLAQTDANSPKVPEIDTLVLNWNFSTLSKTDSSGQAIVLDASSGSAPVKYNANFEAVKNKFYFGKLDFMPVSDEKAIDVDYITAARSTYPEILQGDDMIEIRTQDDIVFTKETLPQEYYIAFEKSMAQTVSQEMINFMSSVTDFNNLIGRPVDKYRMEYKALSKLRQLFFERVSNEPDLDKYIDYYKWLDDALGEMLVALVPASLAHSDGVNNVIENYVFSRDKYTNKFPTIEFKAPTPEGGMNTINRHLYPWKQGHAPVGGTPENKNCFWWLERAERDRPPLSGSASGSNNTRVKVFQARNSVLNRSFTTPQHFAVKRDRVIHGGINYEDNKKRDYIWSATKEAAEYPLLYGQFGAFPLRYVVANSDMFQSLKDCTDERPVTEKIKRAFSAIDGFTAFHHAMSGGHDGLFKGGMVMPFNIMSSSVTTGYSAEVNGIPGGNQNIDIVNVHSDTTDNTNEIPMQSPFTERWVGGHQSRHSNINRGSDSPTNRAEGYKILINNILNESGSIGIVGADYPVPHSSFSTPPHFYVNQAKARYYRDERAKRPVNIKNIKTSERAVGNYQKTYQFVHTFGRSINKTRFRDIGDSNLHNPINSALPETNLEASLISRGVGGNGNLASNFNTSSLYLGGVKTTTENSVAGTGKSVIVNRFSAPGGFETMSEVFLDMFGKEKSAYNSLPFRNLQVRGSGSGESGTIRLVDIHGNRFGLVVHLTRHAAQFGIDSVLGGTNPAYHKVNRNPKWDASEGEKDFDNYWIQHQIPQSDFQYKWVKASHTASLATSSLAGHILSDFSEPSGTSSIYPHENINYAVVSQSVTNQRMTGTTVYGYPSWEQVRNNDTNKNVVNKKSYGYSLETDGTAETIEESRITENIPIYTTMKFKDEIFRFVHPYVNMKYHFDNTKFDEEGVNPSVNETIYDNVLGYYKNEDHEAFSLKAIRVRQNLFPDFLKHTKYNVRHRHYFVSKFWTDGENVLYNTDTGENSYLGLDEVGRRQQNVTASLFSKEAINSQTKTFIDSGQLTNIIPSQSIWNMDSRINFTSSSPKVAASNSAGAPGVLQNQDHHFHNGLQTVLVTGSTATGSIITTKATVFGKHSSGSFTVHGMTPTGVKATGSFEFTSSATVLGTRHISKFYVSGAHVPAASASLQFNVTGATTVGQFSTASFEMSGASFAGSTTQQIFTFSGGGYTAGSAATANLKVLAIPRYGDRFAFIFSPKSISTITSTPSNYHETGLTFKTQTYHIVTDNNDHTDNYASNIHIPVYNPVSFIKITSNSMLSGGGFSGFTNDQGTTILFTMKNKTGINPSADGTYNILKIYRTGSGTHAIEILYQKSGANNHLICRRYYQNSNSNYIETRFTNFFAFSTNGNNAWHAIKLSISDTNPATEEWSAYSDGTEYTTKTTTYNGVVINTYAPSAPAGNYFVGDNSTNFDLSIGEIGIYDSTSAPSETDYYNSGEWTSLNDLAPSTNLVTYWSPGNYVSDDISSGDITDIGGGTNHLSITPSTATAVELLRSEASYSNKNLKSDQEFGLAWVEKLNASFTANSQPYTAEVFGNSSTVRILADDVGYDLPTAYDITKDVTVGETTTTYEPFSSTTYFGAQHNTISGEIVSNSNVNIKGGTHKIKHSSPLDEGNVYTFAGDGTANVYTPRDFLIAQQRSRSWRWTSTGLAQRMDVHNDSYTISGDFTVCFWLKSDNIASSTNQYILSFAEDSKDTTPSDQTIVVYYQYDDLYIRMYNSSGYYNEWKKEGIMKTTRFQFFSITFDVDSIQNDPELRINSALQSYDTTSKSNTGALREVNSIFVADSPFVNSSNFELQGCLAHLSIWDTLLGFTDIEEIYNKGYARNLQTHPKYFSNCLSWWVFSGGQDNPSTGDMPNFNATPSTVLGAEKTLSGITTPVTGVDSQAYTIKDENLTFVTPSHNSNVNLTFGVVHEGRPVPYTTGLSSLVHYTASTEHYFNHLEYSLESDSEIASANYTTLSNQATYVVTRNVQETDNDAVTLDTGSMFANTFNDFGTSANFTGGNAASGLGVAPYAASIQIRKGNDYTTGAVINDGNYLYININDFGNGTDTAGAGHTLNPVNIEITDYTNTANLYNKIVSAINNSSLVNVVATLQNTNEIRVDSVNAGGGNAYFLYEASTQVTINTATGGGAPSGSTTGHSIDIDGTTVNLASNNSANTSVNVVGVADSDVWSRMETVINSGFVPGWEVLNRSSVGNKATFNIVSKNRGEADNGVVTSSHSSFNVTNSGSNGQDDVGAQENDRIKFPIAGSQFRYLYIAYSDRTSENTTTRKYLDSTVYGTTHTNFWNALKAQLESAPWYYAASYVDNLNGTATFTVTSSESGATGNRTGAAYSSPTFTAGTNFSNGTDESGIRPGDDIIIFNPGTGGTKTFTPTTSDNSGVKFNVLSSSVNSSSAVWENLRSKINSNTTHTANTGSVVGGMMLFSITSSVTGTTNSNPNVTEDGANSGLSYNIIDAGSGGTDESGAKAGDTITIGGTTFTIVHDSSPGVHEINASPGVSANAFSNELTFKILNSSSFGSGGSSTSGMPTGRRFMKLTSSVTGTAQNVAFVRSSNNRTFFNLEGAAGGTTPIGIGDLDFIRFFTDTDGDGTETNLIFKVDLNGDESSTVVDKFIDASGYSGTDEEKSTLFWNDLSQSIKDNTVFDTISISPSNNIATFSITSSATGALFNSDITSVYNGADGVGFTIAANTDGGSDESGAKAGDTITINGVTLTLVTGSSAGAGQVLCGTNVNNLNTISNADYFNNLSASIKASASIASVTIEPVGDAARLHMTSSLLGTAGNIPITETGNTFAATGMSGGYDPVLLRFGEIIPQPRYNYPHVLTSPGSLRSPTAKSSLGLISAEYKLRSNHFNLTRSLGYATDGLYDNTSRWTTPDLSGLTPMDDDYNTWYENIRGHNKHFSLVPEFRISSHVKDIVAGESSEVEYFKKNYWLEITGTSADNGVTVNRNTINISGNEFLKEYSISSDIKNMENFIEENRGDASVAKLTLTCDAIMSFLPYDGFYPQSRTVQMCEAFADSYGRNFLAEEADESNTNLLFPDNNTFAQSRPIFDAIMSPGLLYNTIKSGMAVDYPIITSKLATASLSDPYGGKNYMINNEYFDDRLPFETLINPEAYLASKRIVDANPHISSSVNLRTEWNGIGDKNYKLMSNNFFAEAIGFFLEDGKTSRIISKPDNHPDFGVVIANHAGILPVYRSIFKVYKSKKQHPWVEFKGVTEVVKTDGTVPGTKYIDSNKVDKYYYRPPSGTNYFLREYENLTGTDLEYDLESVGYPRPQMNPYAEVETITMYSQPNAFGPPCAGGVAVEFKGLDTDDITPLTGKHNNTTYMMYDSTNGYNAPFTPPYYDGEAWAIYTFTPERAGKHTLSEILEKTTVDFLRYELNHESGSYGDRGTFGPQGFAINENAMQIDASFNLFKQVSVYPAKYSSQGVISEIDTNQQNAGKAWVIESKFETPILDFSKYLNRPHNAAFESEVSTSDIHTASMSLSGTRSEPDVLSAAHSSLSAVHELSGILNPIGMWHQYGEFPESDERGIFMQMMDVPDDYTILGTELTIANPKYTVVKPDINDCDGAGLNLGYNKNPGKTILPYFKKQEIRRKLVGKEDLSVLGSSIQLINKDDGIIIDAELNSAELTAVYGSIQNAQSSSGLFTIIQSSDKTMLTTNSAFTGGLYTVFINTTASSASYPQKSSGSYQGNWATAYYNYDRAGTYTPILIEAKDYASLSFDYGSFSRGLFEDFLKEFSIGVKYTDQSADLSDRADISCVDVDGKKQIVPVELEDKLVELNPSIKSFAKIDMSDKERRDFFGLKGKKKKNNKKFKGLKSRSVTRRFKLIPDNPAVASSPSAATTSSYDYPEPTFIRGSIRYNAGGGTGLAFENKVQMAPQNDKNFARNASTVRWGKFMHSEGSTISTKSLADLVGFSQEKVKMGVTAQTKIIREAVIAIPYIAIEDNERQFLTLDKFEVDKYLFQNNLVSKDRLARTPASRTGFESSIGQSVKDQIDKMQKYNLPPHLDFIENDIEPLPMYIFEFEKSLDREDLNGIWQGVRTESLKKVEFKQETISHDVNVDELLGGLFDENGDGIESLKDVKWMIFKVKQKGARNYDEKMESDLADGRFGFAQQNSDDTTSSMKLGYNWPYDFFSMVENVKVSVDITMLAEEKDTSNADNSIGYDLGIITTENIGTVGVNTAVVGGRSEDSTSVSLPEYKAEVVIDADNKILEYLPSDDTDSGGGGTPKGGDAENKPLVVSETTRRRVEREGDGSNPLGGSGINRGDGIDGRY